MAGKVVTKNSSGNNTPTGLLQPCEKNCWKNYKKSVLSGYSFQ